MLQPDDVIIAVMGPVQACRSTFINALLTQQKEHGLISRGTGDIQTITLNRYYEEKPITLVDIPGYGDSKKSDLEILKSVSQWLEKIYRRDVKLAGILYMHRISDVRVGGTELKNLHMFDRLCGERAMGGVVLVTTMWDRVAPETGERREKELRKEYWSDLLGKGARTARFFGTSESAKAIIDRLILEQTRRETLLLQAELVDQEKLLYETHAGQELHSMLRQLSDEQEETVKKLTAQIEMQTSLFLAEALQREKVKVEQALQKTVEDIRQLTSKAQLGIKITRVFGKKRKTHIQLQSIEQPRQRTEADPVPPSPQTRLQALAQNILQDHEQRALISTLTGDDAQRVADFFSSAIQVLQENATPDADQGKHILSLLCKLAKSAGVCPQCYFLKGVTRDAQPIAGGGFADVYKGKHEQRKICLKVVRVYQKKANARLLRTHAKEIILWAHLSNPNILPFYGVYQLEEPTQRICIVSPWMENGNLRTYLDGNPGTPRILLLLDIIEGLAYLHQSGVVHGDLKAENILVSNDKHALIADFGLSYVATNSGLTNSTTLNGTTRWKAPELFANHKGALHPTQESDIWSFSCICYEVLAREFPFYQYNDNQVIYALLVAKEIPSRPSEGHIINDEMWDIMEKCWSYIPEKRPTCDTIRQSITDLQVRDDRAQSSTQGWDAATFRKAMREKSGTKVDFKRVEKILLRIQGLRGVHKAPVN